MSTERRVLFAVLAVVGCSRATPPAPPPMTTFARDGLELRYPPHWAVSEGILAWAPAFIPGAAPPAPRPDVVRAVIEPPDHGFRLEVTIEPLPAFANLSIARELERRARWGEAYELEARALADLEGRVWLRSVFHADASTGIEYATVDREHRYVATLFGPPDRLVQIERAIAPTLRIAGGGPGILGMTAPRADPAPVARALESTVLIVTADVVDGELRPAEQGSGVVASADGSVIVNDHVLRDRDGRFHDVLVLATAGGASPLTQVRCAGTPAASKVERELDLALVKCDRDLDGHPLAPAKTAPRWPTPPFTGELAVGQHLWVLGYADLAMAEPSAAGAAVDAPLDEELIHTDGMISHGNSGGPVIDDGGHLVGLAAAYEVRLDASGTYVESTRLGRVRPLRAASDLLAIATAGWSPDQRRPDAAPNLPTGPGPDRGTWITTTIKDAGTGAAIGDALIMVMKPGVTAAGIDMNRLDDQVLSWGRSNAAGEVQLKQRVPTGAYTIVVTATGYEPLIGADELRLAPGLPEFFDPWGGITLLPR